MNQRNFFISKCCQAEAQIVFSELPDFIGDNIVDQKIGTNSFKCMKCGKPCDILPLEEVFKKDDFKEDDYKWSLTITRVHNGYLLEGSSSSDGTPIKLVKEDDKKDKLKIHERLLWEIIEYFNFGGSKHDKERIQIIRKKQRR